MICSLISGLNALCYATEVLYFMTSCSLCSVNTSCFIIREKPICSQSTLSRNQYLSLLFANLCTEKQKNWLLIHAYFILRHDDMAMRHSEIPIRDSISRGPRLASPKHLLCNSKPRPGTRVFGLDQQHHSDPEAVGNEQHWEHMLGAFLT